MKQREGSGMESWEDARDEGSAKVRGNHIMGVLKPNLKTKI